MNILGIGILFGRGRGVESYRQALEAGWQEPAVVSVKDRKLPVYQVDLERVQDKAVLKKLRRSDKLSKMAVLAAADAFADSRLGAEEKKKMGVIVATAFGAHVTTFDFLDGILDFGEAAVSPTVFSNSVHNAAASYISTTLEIQGPTLTVTRFFFSFHAALQLADAWLREGRVEHVLVGAVDQFGEVMGYIVDSKLILAADGKIRPFQFKPAAAVPGEGAAFFVVSRGGSDRTYCRVVDIRFGDDQGGPARPDLDVLDADGMLTDESVYLADLDSRTPVAAYSPLYGSMMIGSAFSCAAGALMLQGQKSFSNPVLENPQGLGIVRETEDSPVEFIRCIRYNCYGEKAAVYLRKK
jgi:3-oxoacyl-[acyl-carrier-protein] synthase II